ncbi:hypothetical protein ACFLYR_08935 [Chloroflexota bacterium]
MNKKYILHILIIWALFICVLSSLGCSSTKIGDILDNASQFEGKEVSIKGTVGETIWFGLLERGGYQLGDGTGNIWIITNQPPPEKGKSISVKGTVKSAFSLGGQSFGTVISESKRS